MPSRGIPLEGDRGAFDTVDHADKHALDIKNDVPIRHTPLPGGASEVVISSGEYWITRLLRHDELADIAPDDHHTRYTDNEVDARISAASINDLRDVDTSFPVDGSNLTWNTASKKWVPVKEEGRGGHDLKAQRLVWMGW
jgi:hypothetical protein